jgi:hypothetical protein
MSGNPLSKVLLSSVRSNWRNLVAEEHRVPSGEPADVMYTLRVVSVNLGRPVILEVKKDGRCRRVLLRTLDINHQSCTTSLATEVSVDSNLTIEGHQ